MVAPPNIGVADLPAALERIKRQQEPPAGGGPKGPITEEDIRNAISDREIIDVTTPSDGEEAETEARTTLTAKKHTENKEQEAEVEAMSDTSEPPRDNKPVARKARATLRENPWLEKLVLPSEKNTEDDEMNEIMRRSLWVSRRTETANRSRIKG
ncbi:hypothetical protein PInf_007441 [Phytophthora infestans]|nr:hypothetical protein PInf_007441 [Phytophthora infestans]